MKTASAEEPAGSSVASSTPESSTATSALAPTSAAPSKASSPPSLPSSHLSKAAERAASLSDASPRQHGASASNPIAANPGHGSWLFAPHKDKQKALPPKAPAAARESREGMVPRAEQRGKGGVVVQRTASLEARTNLFSNAKIEDFKLKKEIGRGRNAVIYAATCKATELKVAIKAYVKEAMTSTDYRRVSREVSFLMMLKHDHIINWYGHFEDPCHIFIVQEWAAGGDLFEELRASGGHMAEQRIVSQVLLPLISALQHMHRIGIVHRDLKPENLLLTAGGVMKVCDFGLAINVLEESPQSRLGTLQYMAPEVVSIASSRGGRRGFQQQQRGGGSRGMSYDERVDIWACGVLVFELALGYPPFDDVSNELTAFNIQHKELTLLPSLLSVPCQDFIRKVLVKDPRKRLTLEQMEQHPFVSHCYSPPPPLPLHSPPVLQTQMGVPSPAHSPPKQLMASGAAAGDDEAASAASSAAALSSTALSTSPAFFTPAAPAAAAPAVPPAASSSAASAAASAASSWFSLPASSLLWIPLSNFASSDAAAALTAGPKQAVTATGSHAAIGASKLACPGDEAESDEKAKVGETANVDAQREVQKEVQSVVLLQLSAGSSERVSGTKIGMSMPARIVNAGDFGSKQQAESTAAGTMTLSDGSKTASPVGDPALVAVSSETKPAALSPKAVQSASSSPRAQQKLDSASHSQAPQAALLKTLSSNCSSIASSQELLFPPDSPCSPLVLGGTAYKESRMKKTEEGKTSSSVETCQSAMVEVVKQDKAKGARKGSLQQGGDAKPKPRSKSSSLFSSMVGRRAKHVYPHL